MEELLQVYTELVKGANDAEIPLHLGNLIQDAATLAQAIKNVVEGARQRAAQQQPTQQA